MLIPQPYRFAFFVLALFALVMPLGYALILQQFRNQNVLSWTWYLTMVAYSAIYTVLGAIVGFGRADSRWERVKWLSMVFVAGACAFIIQPEAPILLVFSMVLGMGICDDLAKTRAAQTYPPTPDHITSSPE